MVAKRLPAPKFGGVRTGGRSARVVDQVLATTIELLGESGYAALRFDEVAERSGVNKTTIYRRWPTKSQLVGAALRGSHPQLPARDTGDLERDLTEMFVESLSRYRAQVTRSLMRMVQAERGDPEVAALITELRAQVVAIRRTRFDLAIARGELPAGTDVVLLLNMMSSACYTKMLSFDEPPTVATVENIVRIVIAGARVHWAGTEKPTTRKKR